MITNLGAHTWSCLCWVSVCILGFYFLSVRRRVWWLWVACRKIFCDPDRCSPWGFQIKCISGYWCCSRELNGYTGRRKAGCPTSISLFPWELRQRVRRGHSRWSATELGTKLGIMEGANEDLQLAYLLCCLDSQGVPAELGSWNHAMGGEREDWRGRSVWSGSDGDIEEGEAATGGLLQSWGWDSSFGESEGKVKICS